MHRFNFGSAVSQLQQSLNVDQLEVDKMAQLRPELIGTLTPESLDQRDRILHQVFYIPSHLFILAAFIDRI